MLLATLALLAATGATTLAFISIKPEAVDQHLVDRAIVTTHLQQLQDELTLP